MDGSEIELKLAVAPGDVARLSRLAALKAHRVGRPATKTLQSVYYDTPGLALAEAGVTVRLRQSSGGLVQTVKTTGSRASGLFARREWECAVPSPALDRDRLGDTGLDLLRDKNVVDALAPCFATDIRRTLHHLHGGGWQVEMAVDRGEIRAGERTEAVCEIELELKQGTPDHLFTLARQIAGAMPVRLMARSKSDRGHDLAAGRPPCAARASGTDMDDDATIAEAFRSIARNCLHHLLANQGVLLDHGDAEAVHQMRVALRRLRSALKIFRPLVAGPQLAAIGEEIRWLLGRLGPARDAEVFLTEIIDPVATRYGDQPGMQDLRQLWRAQRDQELQAAQAAVDDPRFTLLLLDLGAWVEAGDWCTDPSLPGAQLGGQPVRPFARQVLSRLARKLRKAGGKKLHKLSPPALHRTRILSKQLRYAAEFFVPLFGKGEAKDYLKVLSRLQDCLGQINDIAVAAPRLATAHDLGHAAWASGLVGGWHEARRPELAAKAQRSWATLRGRRKFWKA
ncbi:MAG TPA: CHAD domain-containing protein [Magnetospirillum sp.]|nr:CHAD domain-containing protein [Magnetospirillum sp.]